MSTPSTAWSRDIAAMGGGLGAIQRSNGEVTLQLANMHGDVVASASIKPEETKLLSTQSFDEFGDPVEGTPLQGGSAEYGWLGSKSRRTQLPSGVIQMGKRSYVPALGRFISTDPVPGGSANAYDYANADPVNGLDLNGEVTGCGIQSYKVTSRHHRIYSKMRYSCPKSAWPFAHALLKVQVKFERRTKGTWDEIWHGKFETKGHAEWSPRNPYDPKWRSLREDENYRCGELGRQYQMVITINVKLQSPIGGVAPPHDETFEARGRATCRR